MIYLTNRDGGLTDEEGHYKYLAAAFTGNVISGMSVEQNSPLGMSVVVSGGDARVPYGNYAYSVWIPSGSPETATIPTADGSNPRIDRIVLYVDRSEDTQQVTPNNPGIAKIAVVAGTPGAIPVRPSDSDVNSAVSNNPWINLADVLVGTGVTQITNANITDTRVMVGPVIPNGFIGTGPIAQGAVTAPKTDFGGDYSTSEVNTGFKWVDGKDIYKKTINFGSLPNSGATKNVAHGITNLENVVHMFGTATDGTTIIPLPHATTNTGFLVQLQVTSTNVTIMSAANRTSSTGYVTLYYTKTS